MHSVKLWEELAEWTTLLTNSLPSYVRYRAVNSTHMLTKDKEPGVCPLLCGTIFMWLWGDCFLDADTRELAYDVCSKM